MRTLILPGPGDGEAWIVDGGVLRYQGGEAKKIDPPAKGARVLTASAAPDGTLWAIADGALFARKGDAWEQAPLPDGAKAQDVAVGSDGAVWVAAGGAILKHGGAGEAAGAAPGTIQLQKGPPPNAQGEPDLAEARRADVPAEPRGSLHVQQDGAGRLRLPADAQGAQGTHGVLAGALRGDARHGAALLRGVRADLGSREEAKGADQDRCAGLGAADRVCQAGGGAGAEARI